ncbi:fibroblast growth factor 22 isoform X4 [Strix aluco]|uniref:fibroblast growth factor 22 isoform X4 n=1 Tax=Strix aluco TaxID=111821 RepID=UPI003DA5C5A9
MPFPLALRQELDGRAHTLRPAAAPLPAAVCRRCRPHTHFAPPRAVLASVPGARRGPGAARGRSGPRAPRARSGQTHGQSCQRGEDKREVGTRQRLTGCSGQAEVVLGTAPAQPGSWEAAGPWGGEGHRRDPVGACRRRGHPGGAHRLLPGHEQAGEALRVEGVQPQLQVHGAHRGERLQHLRVAALAAPGPPHVPLAQ